MKFSKNQKKHSLQGFASLFICQRTPLRPGEKNKEKIFQSHESSLRDKKVKPEKYDAHNKTLKKWLLILGSENVRFNKPLFKEKALEFTNELNVEGLQVLKG